MVRDLRLKYASTNKFDDDVLSEDTFVLKGIDFDIKPGSRCAVVGRSGAGKTSLGM